MLKGKNMSNDLPQYTQNFANVYLAELDYVKKRRNEIKLPSDMIVAEMERVRELKAQTESEEVYETPQNPPQGIIKILMAWFFDSFKKCFTQWFGKTRQEKPSHKQTPHINVASTQTGLVGLALSGGGIRSATFNLGLLQSLAKNKVFQYCDYLSTVSGGGYIGSCLNSLLANHKAYSSKPEKFPFRKNDNNTLGERDEVNHLRATKNYLGLGSGIFNQDVWHILGTTISGLLLMSLLPLALILSIVSILYLIPLEQSVTLYFWEFKQDIIGYKMVLGLVILAVSIIFIWMVLIRLRLSFFKFSHESHIYHNKRIANRTAIASLLTIGTLLLSMIYGLAWYYAREPNVVFYILGISLLIILAGLLSTSQNKFQQTFIKAIISTALIVFVVALLSWLLSGWYASERLQQFKSMIEQMTLIDKKPLQSELLKKNLFLFKYYLNDLSHIETPTGKKWWTEKFKELSRAEAEAAQKKMTNETVEKEAKKAMNEAILLQKLKQLIQSYGLIPVLNKMEKPRFDNTDKRSKCIDCDILQLIEKYGKEKIDEFVKVMQSVENKTLSIKLVVATPVGVVIIILVILSFLISINRNSLHYFYRDRLSNTYLIRWNDTEGIQQNHALLLTELHQYYNGPYYLINTTLNVPRSKNPSLSGRGADFFIFSKYYCGAESTGYRSTESYQNGQTKLATAMAISGAAASPQMGTHTKPLMVILMTLLNARLNLWMPNPNPKHSPKFIFWPTYFFKELFRTSTENDALLNLSDGAHHENLGIYPLLKRRCKVIIASDAGADPKFQMDDLANLQRKARIDLGIDIELDMSDLCPDSSSGYSQTHFVKGTLHYPDNEEGTLFYIKTTLTGTEPQDLLAYRRAHSSFPDETTADQFFNEDQFESYRKLGELSGDELFSKEEDVTTIFGTHCTVGFHSEHPPT
jgi:hypothetical protein